MEIIKTILIYLLTVVLCLGVGFLTGIMIMNKVNKEEVNKNYERYANAEKLMKDSKKKTVKDILEK